ncbi:pre-60S ribosomal particles component [Coemansia brasiliensis]|uniref:Pre-60S ribosomal particles component n=1 Tax=Coemansia brasiliensis TaxID=2650707 RepID=A0A9W8IDS0_9FUNG|nr:pre-60S ribosomal particles component [Coemansia brasiliensis]
MKVKPQATKEPIDSDASSSSDEAMQSASEAESDYEELARKHKQSKKSKRAKVADSDEFADTLTSILNQSSGAGAPIMSKNRVREKQIKEEKLNYRARKALVEEKRRMLSKDLVLPSMQNSEHERKLRKIATKGVIKLFNVVKAQQTELAQINSGTASLQTEKVAEMSKSKFLDMLKAKTS